MTPMVSVHMVTYNQKKYIAEAIDSILAQKVNFQFELVIGDDYSSDGTREIVQAYAQRFPGIIRAIPSEKNLGAIENAQKVTGACKGKYIAYCEGDDFWHNINKLQKQVDYLENHKDYGLVHSDFDLITHKGNRIKKINSYNSTQKINPPSEQFFEKLLYSRLILIRTCTTCFRAEYLKELLNYSIIKNKKWQLDDLPLWLEISTRAKVAYLNESMATYRVLEESASNTKNSFKRYIFHKSIFEIKFYYWGKYSQDPQIKEKLDIEYNKCVLDDAYHMNNKTLAKIALDFFKNNNIHLSIKHKAKYWFINNRLARLFFLYMAKKIKNYRGWRNLWS